MGFGEKISLNWPSWKNSFERKNIFIAVWAKYINLQDTNMKYSLFTIQSQNKNKSHLYEWALNPKDERMHLLYNGENISGSSISTSISGDKLEENKWFLTYIKRDSFSIDTRVISSDFNSTMTYEIKHENGWKDANIFMGTNGDVHTWQGKLFAGVISEDYDIYGNEEEKFHFNKEFIPIDDILYIPNLGKDSSKLNNWANVLVVKETSGGIIQMYESSKKENDKLIYGDELFNSQILPKSYLSFGGIETERKPEMGYRMIISGEVEMINRAIDYQYDEEFYQGNNSIMPIYRLLDFQGTNIIELISDSRPLHRRVEDNLIPRSIKTKIKYKIGKNKFHGKYFNVRQGDSFTYKFIIVIQRELFSTKIKVGIEDYNYHMQVNEPLWFNLPDGYFPSISDQHLIGWEKQYSENRMPVIDFVWSDFAVRFGSIVTKSFSKQVRCDENSKFELGFEGLDS